MTTKAAHPLVDAHNSAKRLSPLYQGLAVFWLIARFGTALTILGIVTLVPVASVANNASQPEFDPFAPYMAILPEQPASALAAYDCKSEYLPSSLNRQLCTIQPAMGRFELIQVTSRDGVIVATVFTIRRLRIGDLVQLWGMPQPMTKERHRFTLSWGRNQLAFADREEPFTFDRPIRSVLFRTF